MNDKDIIKALECCGIIGRECDEKCPRYSNGMYEAECQRDVIISALDIINRQKAEIERLHKEVGYWEAETKEARADIDQAVAEAIKEVAEVLEAELESANKYIREYDDSAEQRAYTKGLHNAWSIVKEMVGERE